MDILLVGNSIGIHDLAREIGLLDYRAVCVDNTTDLFLLDESDKFDLIIFDEELCSQITRDELEKIRYIRGKGYGVPIAVFAKDVSNETIYKRRGFSKVITSSHLTEELENFLIDVSMGKVDI